MSKKLGALVGVCAAVAAAGAGGHLSNFSNHEQTGSGVEVGAATVEDRAMAALAIGQLSGVITVNGEYNLDRIGPVNCDIKIQAILPFTAYATLQLADLQLHKSAPDAAGKVDISATVQGSVKALNPHTKFNDLLHPASIKETDDNFDFTNICGTGDAQGLINKVLDVGGKATATVAECMVNSLSAKTVLDGNGNKIETEPSKQIHLLYERGLKSTIKALYPNEKTITIKWPDEDPSYDPTNSPLFKALSTTIKNESSGGYKVNADAVNNCAFDTVKISLSPQKSSN